MGRGSGGGSGSGTGGTGGNNRPMTGTIVIRQQHQLREANSGSIRVTGQRGTSFITSSNSPIASSSRHQAAGGGTPGGRRSITGAAQGARRRRQLSFIDRQEEEEEEEKDRLHIRIGFFLFLILCSLIFFLLETRSSTLINC